MLYMICMIYVIYMLVYTNKLFILNILDMHKCVCLLLFFKAYTFTSFPFKP